MIIAKVVYPPRKINPSFGKDKFLNDIKDYAIHYLTTLFHSNNLNDIDMLNRLNMISSYLKTNFNIQVSIQNILKEIIYSLSFTEDEQYIQIPINSKFSGIKIEVLYRIISYGCLDLKGVGNIDILQRALAMSFDYFIRTGFISKWGWV